MKNERKGELLILVQAFLWGSFPIFTKVTTESIPLFVSLAMTTIFTLPLFIFLLLYRGKSKEIFNPQVLKDATLSGIFIGFGYYFFMFYGIQQTSASSAAIIGQLEVVTSLIFFNLINKEYISKKYVYGIFLMLAGGFFILSPNFTGIRIGDISILVAICLAPLGNFFQRRARGVASAEAVLLVRSFVASVCCLSVALYISGIGSFYFSLREWMFLFLNGAVAFGLSKILWLEGIYRIGVAKANAINILSLLIAIFFSFLYLKEKLTLMQLLSVPFMIIGLYLLTRPLPTENKT